MIIKRFSSRPDSEHEQALIRIVIVAFLTAMFWQLSAAHPEGDAAKGFILAAIYLAVSFLYVGAIALWPMACPLRRLCALLTDLASLSWLMRWGGEPAASLYPVYLWISLGYGFRYGLPYLGISIVVSVAGFTLMLAASAFWQAHLALGIGLLAGLIAIPAYAGTLIRKLTEAKALAERASLAKSRFLAIVSHELRTPLNAITGMGDLLADTSLDHEQRSMVRTLRNSATTLLSLIDSILNFSRIEAGKLELAERPVDLPAELANLVDVFEMESAGKGLEFSFQMASTVPWRIQADWPSIRQVVTNLVSNAIKFTESGYVRLLVNVNQSGDQIRFTVEDSGIGIPASELDRVFDRFTQADESIGRRFGGTGLGLAICRQLAEQLRGGITVQSTVGEGSRFEVNLPVKAVPGDAAPIRFENGSALITVGETAAATQLNAALTQRGLRVSIKPTEAPADQMAIFIDGQAADACLAELRTKYPTATFILLAALDQPAPQACRVILRWPCDDHDIDTTVAVIKAFDGQQRLAEEDGRRKSRRKQRSTAFRLLVAEDNRVNRRVIRKILTKAGHDAILVSNGEQALEAIEADDGLHGAILDINMPGISGLEVVKLYRASQGGGPRLPIIALTADATEATRRLAEQAGFDAYVCKPIEPDALLDIIESLAETYCKAASKPVLDPEPLGELIDWRAVDRLRRLGDDDGFFRNVVEDFVIDSALLLDRIAAAAEKGDFRRFRKECHGLRSSSSNLGASAISQLCQQCANLTGEQIARDLPNLIEALRGHIVAYQSEVIMHLASGNRSQADAPA